VASPQRVYFEINCFKSSNSDASFRPTGCKIRYQDYKLVKDSLYIYGFQKRILKPFVKSRCQSDAAKTAASELGMSNQYREYSKSIGYKWYHLFPDVIFKNPAILFTKNFWSSTLFAKTYHAKIDFKN